jgi:hypothetical protein
MPAVTSFRCFDHHDSVSGAGDRGVAESGAGVGGRVEGGICDSSSIGVTEDATGGIGCGDGGAGVGGRVEGGIRDSSSIGGTEDATGGIGCGDGDRFGLKHGTIAARNLDALLGSRPRRPVLKLMVRWKF